MARQPRPTTRRRAACRRRGLTLLELLLALSGMALIGSAIASMLVAVTYGTDTDKDMRTLVTKQMTLRARISAAIRESTMVLERGDGYLYLWVHDTDESGNPNLDELLLFEFDAGTQTFSTYRAPDAPSANPEYDLASSFTAQTVGVRGNADFPATRWASGVTGFETTLDNATVQDARLISFRLTLAAGEEEGLAVGAAALRNGGDE